MRLMVLAVLALVAVPGATAGSAEAPELVDAEGDCALPYAAPYLDVIAVWIEAETVDAFVVAMRLAVFDPTLAEGAGYVAQFRHQGETWGVLATFRPASDGGWAFFTGVLTPEDAQIETFQRAEGSFDAESATIRVPFPKSIFPHSDAADGELTGFYAGSADLRTAYPFLLVGDRVDPDSSDGRWLMCDEGASDATYAFQVGAHSGEHAAHIPLPEEDETAPAPQPAAAVGAVEAPQETPLAAWSALLAALGAACLARRR